MKKRIILALFLISIVTTTVGATAVGGIFSYSFGGNNAYPGGALTIKLDNYAPIFGIGVRGSGDYFALGATADWWMQREHLTGMINYYIGPGAYINLVMGDSTSLDLGARLPIGLQIFPIKNLEVFLEVAPSLGLALDSFNFHFGVQPAFGIRFWF